MTYVIGSNQPGYLPDQVAYPADDLDHAKQCLLEDMEQFVDEQHELFCTSGIPWHAKPSKFQLREYDEALEEFRAAPAQECNVYLGDRVFWIAAE